jgi:hypothetical protein
MPNDSLRSLTTTLIPFRFDKKWSPARAHHTQLARSHGLHLRTHFFSIRTRVHCCRPPFTMGKRRANTMSNPDLVGSAYEESSKRRCLVTQNSAAALTLLSLRQESVCTATTPTKVDEADDSHCELISFDRRERSHSVCSSVTEDDQDEYTITSCVYPLTRDSQRSTIPKPNVILDTALLKMALKQPHLRLAGRCPVQCATPATSTMTTRKLQLFPEGQGEIPTGTHSSHFIFHRSKWVMIHTSLSPSHTR